VHLRRALLLFAIVLAMAALAASLSRPLEPRRTPANQREPRDRAPATVSAQPAPPPVPAPLELDATKNRAVRMPAGHAATLEVSVPEAGNVAIPDMGLSAAADRFTPARFDIFASKPGRYELRFTPAVGGPEETAGRLVVTSGR
jgi:hypothetical protein